MQLLATSKNHYLIAGLVFFGFLLALNARLSTPTEPSYPNVQYISSFEAYQLINKENILVLDVREKDAYERAHIPNAISVPIGELQKRLDEFSASKAANIVVYCNDGSTRGPKATNMLNNAGYGGAKNLEGGLQGWTANSYQTVTVK